MSRQILAYDDFDDPHASTPPPSHISDGRGPSQRAAANGAAFDARKEISPGQHIGGVGKKGKADKRKQKQLQKQPHQHGPKGEQGHAGGASEEENARKRKKRKFEESVEHDRVHWDAQGQREFGTVEVPYDDGAGDGDPASNLGATATARPQLAFEDALNSMFDDAEMDMSESEGDAEEARATVAGRSNTTNTQQVKDKKVENPKKSTYRGAPVNSSKPGSGFKKEDKGKAAQKAPMDTTALLMDTDAWDDSVLIDAWDAAMEEYQIMNGPEADWKKDPVHKDSIWYKSSHTNLQWQDVKPAASEKNFVKSTFPVASASTAEASTRDEGDNQMKEEEEEEGPAIAGLGASVAADPERQAADILPAAFDISRMSKDELFQKAVEASYWAGYWAAAYHASTDTHADVET